MISRFQAAGGATYIFSPSFHITPLAFFLLPLFDMRRYFYYFHEQRCHMPLCLWAFSMMLIWRWRCRAAAADFPKIYFLFCCAFLRAAQTRCFLDICAKIKDIWWGPFSPRWYFRHAAPPLFSAESRTRGVRRHAAHCFPLKDAAMRYEVGCGFMRHAEEKILFRFMPLFRRFAARHTIYAASEAFIFAFCAPLLFPALLLRDIICFSDAVFIYYAKDIIFLKIYAPPFLFYIIICAYARRRHAAASPRRARAQAFFIYFYVYFLIFIYVIW